MGFTGGFSNEATYDMHLDIQANPQAKRAYFSALNNGLSTYSLANYMRSTAPQYFNISPYTINIYQLQFSSARKDADTDHEYHNSQFFYTILIILYIHFTCERLYFVLL